MKCDSVREKLSEYLLGNINPGKKKEIDSHMKACRSCYLELEQMESVWEKLGGLPVEEPGPALRSRFYAMLEAEKRESELKDKRPLHERIESWLHHWWPNRPVVQFAFSLGFLVFGLLIGNQLKTGPKGNGELADLRNEVKEMRQIVSVSLLNQSSSSERLRGLSFSTQVDQPTESLLSAVFNALNDDPNINVRLAAVDALFLFSDRPGVRDELVRSLSNQTSPLIQISLIDLLVNIQEKRALNALRALIQDKNVDPAVKEHAEAKLEQLS